MSVAFNSSGFNLHCRPKNRQLFSLYQPFKKITYMNASVGHSHAPMNPSVVMKQLLHCVEAQIAHAATIQTNLLRIYVAKGAHATQTLGIALLPNLGNFSVEQWHVVRSLSAVTWVIPRRLLCVEEKAAPAATIQ